MTKCYKCHRTIMFDIKVKSVRGKLVPLDLNHTPHACINSSRYFRYLQKKRYIREKWFNNYGPRVMMHG